MGVRARPWEPHIRAPFALIAAAATALLVLSACGPEEVGDPPPEPTETESGEDGAEEDEEGADAADSSPGEDGESVPEDAGLEEGPSDPSEEDAERSEDADGEDAADDGEGADNGAGGDDGALAVDDPERIQPISDDFRALMEQTTWEPDCPVAIEDLRKLTLRYVDFDGVDHEGEMIVHVDVAEDLLGVFVEIHARGFPIERMEPIEHFDGDDDASMAANNTSTFNCRPITGSDSWSEHSYGWAVDINPIQNPYERDGEILPPEGEPYLDRSNERPGMVTRPGVVDLFDDLGWGWGGDWDSLVDYMHFSLTGR